MKRKRSLFASAIITIVLAVIYTNCGKQKKVDTEITALQLNSSDSRVVGQSTEVCRDLYEMYPNSLERDDTRLNKVSTPNRDGDALTFVLSMNTVSEKTSNKEQLLAQNLANDHYQAPMYVNISTAFEKRRVDLVLRSEEPTLWILRENVRSVRRVYIQGSRCSTVVVENSSGGIASENVSIVTNDFEHNPIDTPELFSNTVTENVEQGTDIGRAFIVR